MNKIDSSVQVLPLLVISTRQIMT